MQRWSTARWIAAHQDLEYWQGKSQSFLCQSKRPTEELHSMNSTEWLHFDRNCLNLLHFWQPYWHAVHSCLCLIVRVVPLGGSAGPLRWHSMWCRPDSGEYVMAAGVWPAGQQPAQSPAFGSAQLHSFAYWVQLLQAPLQLHRGTRGPWSGWKIPTESHETLKAVFILIFLVGTNVNSILFVCVCNIYKNCVNPFYTT